MKRPDCCAAALGASRASVLTLPQCCFMCDAFAAAICRQLPARLTSAARLPFRSLLAPSHFTTLLQLVCLGELF
jgi:hypothetical protein